MFGISLALLLLFILWAVVLFFIARSQSALARAILPRMLTTIPGILLIFGSFLFQNWLKLSFVSYWLKVPEALEKYVPVKVLGWVGEQFGVGWAFLPLEILEKFTSLKGWMFFLLPTYSLGLHLLLLLPLLAALLALCWLPFGVWKPGSLFGKVIGALVILLALVCILGLLFALPVFDAAGLALSLQGSLIVTLLGMRLGNGPWFMLVGLLCLAAGGVYEIFSGSLSPGELEQGSGE